VTSSSRAPLRPSCSVPLTVLFALSVPLLLLVLLSPAAAAAGNSTIDRFIIANPLRGWQPLPAAQQHSLVSSLARQAAAAASGTNLKTAVAAEGWQDPTTATSLFEIILVGFSSGPPDQSGAQEAKGAAGSDAAAYCTGATGSPPLTDLPLPSIPGSHQVVCRKAPNGTSPTAVTWARANLLATLANNTLTLRQLDAIALAQYRAMPTTETSLSAHSGPGDSWTVGVALAAVGLLGLTAAIVILRRRPAPFASSGLAFPGTGQQPPPTGPSAGWYPDPVNPDQIRYWTGTDWGPEQQPPTPPGTELPG
jgi:hypothetical protein